MSNIKESNFHNPLVKWRVDSVSPKRLVFCCSFVLTKEEDQSFFLFFCNTTLHLVGGTVCVAIFVFFKFWPWLHRSRAPQVEATRWVLVLEEKPTGCTSRPRPPPPLRWLQPRSPTCNSFKPTTSCSCRPSRVSCCCHQVAYLKILI